MAEAAADLLINNYGPGEIQTKTGLGTGRWVYVGWNDEFTWRVGYCHGVCRGHAAPEEAVNHFRSWLLRENTRYDGTFVTPRLCSLCPAQTVMYASVAWLGSRNPLCAEHLNAEGVERVLEAVDLRGILR